MGFYNEIMKDMKDPMRGRDGMTAIWQGEWTKAALAAQMLREHGIEVVEQEDIDARLFVREADKGIAQDLFRDWEF